MDDGRHDFDFVHGRWAVHNRRLRDPLDPDCTVWDEFPTTSAAEPILDGLGNVDRIWCEGTDEHAGLRGLHPAAVRPADPALAHLVVLDPPGRVPSTRRVEGAFADGIGHFQGEDMISGVPLLVQFQWTAALPRWEQAFSFDGGATWVPNWRMDFTRTG